MSEPALGLDPLLCSSKLIENGAEVMVENKGREGRDKGELGLKKVPPYWYPYTTMAKGRWLGREILEVVSTEFRDRSMEYYRYALESGVTTVNGLVAKPDTIIRNGDRIENVVHRHEPPVTSTPVRILHHDVEKEFIVIDKPGSIPVHPTGRYFRNSLVEILENDFRYDKAYTVNRLDRLTSGLMIVALSASRARALTEEFMTGMVRKEYIARVSGKFSEEEVICEEPLLTVDRQMGLNIVHPEGKPAKTIFKRLHYDPNTDSSVLHCRPLTGRSHQIRVHLQYLGYPIANDPVYSETRIWGPNLGRNGIDLTPTDDRSAPAPPSHLQSQNSLNPESSSLAFSSTSKSVSGLAPNPDSDTPETISAEEDMRAGDMNAKKLLPRETGHDIGMGSPVPLSAEAVNVITRLRNMKDENEDWSRWRDVVFLAKGALSPKGIAHRPLPPQNKRRRGGPGVITTNNKNDKLTTVGGDVDSAPLVVDIAVEKVDEKEQGAAPQLTPEEALAKLTIIDTHPHISSPLNVPSNSTSPSSGPIGVDTTQGEHPESEDVLYCSECYLPLHPDPKHEKLYIYLHALRYTTSLGTFETGMPEWAAESWEWDRG